MVLETIKLDWIKKRHYLCLFFGFAYTFIGYGIGTYIFDSSVSIAMLFLATLLLVPTLVKLIDEEEKIERKQGLKHFFRNHRDVGEAYLFLFLGVFLGYVVLGFTVHGFNDIFSFQVNFLENQEGLNSEVIQGFYDKPLQPTLSNVWSILSNNLFIVLITFILSFVYGVGAVFLIVLNSSVFAAFVVYLSKEIATTVGDVTRIMGYFSIHLVPEIAGFLLAAIAGGVFSKAIMNEKFMSKSFRNVTRDALTVMGFAVLLIIIGAFLEVFVTTRLFYSL
jgi:uncharacterized membrane protein SpoIIM required for sporulation